MKDWRLIFYCIALISLLFLLDIAAADDAGSSIPAHLAVAQAMVADLQPDQNEYAHKNCFIHWKGSDGATAYANRTDCSEFINLLMEHTYGVTVADFQKWTGHRRPTAATWYDAIKTGQAAAALSPVARFGDVRPGDIIVIRYPAGEEDTGHMLIVAANPVARRATAPLVDQTDQFEVQVIDSSKSGHGKTDTRHHADGSFGQGVGRGVFRLYVGSDGRLAGYAWSTFANSQFKPASEHPLLIARLTDAVAKAQKP
jgi:hypothetical protein